MPICSCGSLFVMPVPGGGGVYCVCTRPFCVCFLNWLHCFTTHFVYWRTTTALFYYC